VKKSSLIGHVEELYADIIATSKPADHRIDIFFRGRKYLGSKDRRFIAETLYGILRHQKRIEWILSSGAVPHTPVNMIAAYVFLEQKETVLSLTGEVPTSADLLEKIYGAASRTPTFESEIDTLSVLHSFQPWMVSEWRKSFDLQELGNFCKRLNEQAPMTIRVNTLKTTVEECRDSLLSAGIETEKTPYSPFGLILKQRVNLFQLKGFTDGLFEVQDEGSQLLALLVDPKPKAKVVDACAGAGGKSLAMAAVMKNKGEIFALDIHPFRLADLKKRAIRNGVDIVRIKPINEHETIAELIGKADNVLVDAPCSGTGTIRRNPGMKWSVTEAMISEMNEKQKSILFLNADYVKVNGRLIYSTCSTMHAENENVVEDFLRAHPNFELMDPSQILERYHLGNVVQGKYFQLFPHIHNTDGFFAAVMKRIS